MTLRIAIDGRALTDRHPGVGRYLWNLTRALPRVAGDEEIHLLTEPGADDANTRFSLAELEAAGVRRRELRSPRLDLRQQALPRLLAEIGARVFHTAQSLARFRSPRPLVVTVYHALGATPPGPGGRKASRFLSQTLAAARRVVTLSQPVKKELVEQLGIDAGRITVIPGAPDPDLTAPPDKEAREVRRRLRLPPRYVLTLGGDRPHENLARLVEAWAAVKKPGIDKPGETWQLVLAGAHEQSPSEAREKARELGLADVRFLGAVAEADLPAVLATAEVFVLPSLAEGSGLTVLEAMACGTAVACSLSGASPAVAGAGAAYFDPRDPATIAATLTRLMKNAAYREMLAERGAQRAEQLSWETTARQTLKVYRQAATEVEAS